MSFITDLLNEQVKSKRLNPAGAGEDEGDDNFSALGEDTVTGSVATYNTATSSIVTLTDQELFLEKYGSPEVGVSPEQAQKYFGNGARYRFYQRQRWMYGQRFNNSHRGGSMDTTIFDNEYTGDEEFPNFEKNFEKSDKELFGLSSDDESVGKEKDQDNDGGSMVSDISELQGSHVSVEMAKARLQFPDPTSTSSRAAVPLSPRTRYIDNCLRDRVNPRASMVVRRTLSKQLSLKSQGIGDKAAANLAESLTGTPYIHSINLRDNRLTDDGMKPVLDALVTLPNLVELDLSQNEIGPESSAGLAEYLGRKDCPLLKLVLSKADVDDFECEGFISALQGNTVLKEIDLSNNLLGSAEVLNTVMPDLTTGGEAIADWLRADTCVLESLTLSWNMIRLDSAMELCSALSTNSSLTYLDLSYNSLGHDGGLALGDAIIDNRVLKKLIVDNNNIDATACFTICVGVIENMALSQLSMNGNPIGEQGAQALILVPMTVGDRVHVSAKTCNIILRDSRCWFDMKNPCRSYRLTLSHPFERAVAYMLCRIVATHPTCIFKDVGIAPIDDKGKPGAVQPLNLRQTVNKDMAVFMDERRRKVVENLRKVVEAAGDVDKATALFHETDVDGSGELDAEELKLLMDSLGIAIDEKGINAIMSAVDIDGGGVMDEVEFFVFLKSIGRDASNKLTDLLEMPVLTQEGKPSGDKYCPPKEGLFVAEIVDGFVLKPIYRSISSCDNNYAKELAKQSGEAEAMISHALSHGKVRYEEAYDLYKALYRESRSVINSLTRVLPQVTDPTDARNLVFAATDGDKRALLQVKGAFGVTLRVMYGCFNGFYQLDLSKDLHRTCLSRLFENSARRNGLRSVEFIDAVGQGVVGDTSQTRSPSGWTSFRNGCFNGKPTVVCPQNFTPMPTVGKVEFDYSSVERPWQVDTALMDEANAKKKEKEMEEQTLLQGATGDTKHDLAQDHQQDILTGQRPQVTPISDLKFLRLLLSVGLIVSNKDDERHEPQYKEQAKGKDREGSESNIAHEGVSELRGGESIDVDKGDAEDEGPIVLAYEQELAHW